MAGFSGIVVAVITPFTPRGAIDPKSFKWLLEGLVEAGVHGLWVAGTTGEWTSLSPRERGELFQAAVEAVGGKAKVFAGVAGLRLEEALEASRLAGDVGVDYVFSTPPLYFKPDRAKLLEYYERVSEASGKPVYIYTIPGNVGYNIPVEDVEWMVEEYSGIAGIKATVEDYTYLGDLVRVVKQARSSFTVLAGSEELLAHMLAIGGDGIVSAVANVLPGIPVATWKAWSEGDVKRLQELSKQALEARAMISSLGPLPLAIKSILSRLGAPVDPRVRHPLGGSVDASRVSLALCRRYRGHLHPRLPCVVEDEYSYQYL